MKLPHTLRSRLAISCFALHVAAVAGGCAPRPLATGESQTPGAPAPAARVPAAETSSPALGTHLDFVMPRGLTTVGAVTHGGALYLIGGYFGSPHEYSKEFQSGNVSRLNLASGAWEELPPIEPIQSPAVVSDGRYIYKLGGMRADNASSEPSALRSVAGVERFDPAQNDWQALTSMPEPRSSHQAVIAGTTLYVVGGWALHGGMYDNTWSETMLSADLTEPELRWRSEPLPFKIRAQGLAAHRGKLYVMGGLDPNGSTDRVRRYDIAARSWSEGPALPAENLTARAAVWQGELYANGADGNVYRLSRDEQRWEIAGRLRHPRLFHEMIANERGPLVLGGIPSNGRGARVRVIERLSPEPAPAGVVWNVEAEGRAKNRQGAFLWSQQLFVFGGNDSLGQHDFEPENFLSDAHRFDLGALEWREIPPFPRARQSMMAWVGGEDEPRALVLGGFGFEGDHLKAAADVFSYDVKKKTWTELEAQRLPRGSSQFGLTEWGGALWVLGGMSYDASREKEEQFQHRTRLLRLDLGAPGARFEETSLSLGEARRAFAGALLGNTYYLTGGLKENFEPAESCEAVNLEERKLRPFPCPSTHRLGGELIALDGKLYLVGGSAAEEAGEPRQATSLIEVYDPDRERWSRVPARVPLDTLEHLRAFAFQDQLLLYTAQRTDGLVQLALLDPKALSEGRQDYTRLRVAAPPEPRLGAPAR